MKMNTDPLSSLSSELLNWTGHSLSRSTGALSRLGRLILLIAAFSGSLASLRAELGFVITGNEHAGYEAAVHGVFGGLDLIGAVSIPSAVTDPNTNRVVPVTGISRSGFAGFSRLTSITIPSSVTSIGDRAFEGCSGLTGITIPSSVTSIEVSTFFGCSGLTSVTIPSSVTSIGPWAFNRCSGLTSITIPSSVTSIGYNAFQGCSGLTSVIIPSGVTSIEDNAFYGCYGLTSVTIPSSVTSIEDGVFASCTGLTSVTIPSSVTSIGPWAFFNCSGLTSVTIPSSVTSIGTAAFADCSGLTSVTIPSSVTSIAIGAFPEVVVVNVGTGSVTVSDTTAPVLTLPANVAAVATSASGATVTYPAATATDNVIASPTITYSQASGTVFPIGVTTVTVSASDAAGNVGTGTFTVSVTVTAPVTRMTQTIQFLQTPTVTYGDDPIELKATSNSGLPVTISVKSGPAKMSVDGTRLEVTGAGNVVLAANQSGDASYLPATGVNQTLVVRKKVLKVTIPATKRAVGQANPVFGLEYSGFVRNDTKAVLDKKPVVRTDAKLSSPTGVYSVTASRGVDDSYAFEYEAGQMTLLGFGGSYEALMQDESGYVLGKLELTIPNSSMAYTGKLTLSGESAAIAVSGKLIPDGELTEAIGTMTRAAKGVAPALEISFTRTGNGLMASVKKDGANFLSSGTSGALLYTVPANVKAPWAGAYTMIIETDADQDGDGRAVPRGVGYATVTIAPTTGVLAFVGKLADGTTLTGSCKPDADGGYRVFQKPYGARLNSMLAGEMSLQMHLDQDRFAGRYCILVQDGKLVWTKGALTSDRSYRAGFGPVECRVGVDPWIPASAAKTGSVAVTLAQRLGLATTNTLGGGFGIDYGDAIDLGNLQASLPTKASLSATNTVSVTSPVTVPANITKWKMSVSETTGAFSGSFTLSDAVAPATRKTPRTVSFCGVLRQGVTGQEPIGGGFFLLPALPGAGSSEVQSGEFWLNTLTP
jgi:hypothetical protein